MIKKYNRLITEARKNRELTCYWTIHEDQIYKLRKQEKWWEPDITCQECAGLGSLEARLDEDWWKQLESELETIGAWHHVSEEDGCDVMISREANQM